MKHLMLLNPLLRVIGLGVVPKCVGHWYIDHSDRHHPKLKRKSIVYGYRLARLRNYVPDETAFDRLMRRHEK